MSAPTLGRWPVVLAGRARRELRLLAADKNTFDIVRKKLRELSLGYFTKDNCSPVDGSKEYIPIYRARLSNDLRIIYLIDLESDGYNEYDHQIIRVLSVSSRARVVYDFWVKVSKFLRRRGSEYRSRCIQRKFLNTKDGRLRIPLSFLHKAYIPLTVPDPELESDSAWGESEMNELHEAVVLEKYIPVTKSLYNSILADMDAVLPIILTPDEKAIVRYQGTSVVIGRSGTGKTTALVYKMRANAQVAGVSDSAESIRQLFVTRSSVLTRRIASYYNGLIESSEIANKSPEELQIIRQLNQNYQPRDLLQFDNEADLRDDLPDRYSELTGANFPLFISYDKLGQLLEADTLGTDDPLALARIRSKRLVDFKIFKHQYWPKFDYNLTRKLDPALVFSEIMGVIKGYGRDLLEDEYLNGLSSKKSPLLANVRREVYAIFKAYKKRCITRGETDSADRVRTILKAREKGINIGSGVDHLFVDEVQDQLMADIYLLHSLCSNIDGGYWCGDTAQTINVGSSFRIRDLKAYLYEKMVPHANAVLEAFHQKIAAPFTTFELTVNFRSHNGIVKYAASLVQLLYTLFPGSIDHMQPESAPIPGPKPLIFVSPSEDEGLFVDCLLGRRPVDQASPFGPEQAIIVRSEETARSLRTRLQNRCNVLTLFESKGLEFDDLILYGFFAESDASVSAWRMIAILESYEEDGAIRFSPPPDLEPISPSICSELKQLYVAVTRARHRCWLWDSGSTIEMMKNFWQPLGLVKVSDSIDSLSLFAEYSGDPRQWAQRGEGFFSNGLYAVAKTCFERAGREKEVQISDAYNDMSEAGKLPEDSPIAKLAYIEAARKMIACTELHSSHSTATLWYHAGTCFEAAKETDQASQAYSKGAFYDRALLVFFEAQDMPGCLKVILSYSQHIDSALLRRIKEDVSIHFLRQQEYGQLERLHNGNLGECIELARTLRLRAQLKDLLRIARRFEELVTEYLNDGLPAEAVSCLVHCLKSPSAIQRSRDIIASFLWTSFGLGSTPDSKTKDQANLLAKLCNSQDNLLDIEGLQDIKIFGAIIFQELELERISPAIFHGLLGGLNPESEAYFPRVTLLQYHVFKGNSWVSCLSYADFSAYLEIWRAYSASLRQLKALTYPSLDVGIRRLLSLSSPSTTRMSEVIVPIRTPLYGLIRELQGENEFKEKRSKRGVTIDSSHADMHIQTLFSNHAKKELNALSSSLLGSRWTRHAPYSPSNPQDECGVSFGDVVKAFPLVLSTLDSAMNREHRSAASMLTKSNEEKIRIDWSMRLFSVVFASSGSVGELNNALSRTRGGGAATSVRTWVGKTLRLLDPLGGEDTFATLIVACTALLFELQPASTAFAVDLPPKVERATHMQGPMPKGHPRQSDHFTENIFTFFQRKSQWRIIIMHKIIQRMVRNKWFIDISALIPLIEQTTREVILAERSTTLSSYEGFSGLIAPRSWTTDLVMRSTHAEHAHALKPSSLGDFVNRMWLILARISKGIPGYLNVPAARSETHKHQPGIIALRLLWTIMFVMVNLRPGHESARYVQDVLKQFIAKIKKFESSFIDGFEALGFSFSCLPQIIDRKSIFTTLHQLYAHEEVLMLHGRGSKIYPDASLFGGRIIEFNTLAGLRNTLRHNLRPHPGNQTARSNTIDLGSSAISSEGSEPTKLQLDEAKATQIPPRPDTPISIADSEEDELEDAALRIFVAWKRSVERVEQRKRLWEFDQQGRLFEQYRQSFPKLGKKASHRGKLHLQLIRGPCLSIVLGLRLLAGEIDGYLEALNEEVPVSVSLIASAKLGSFHGDINKRRMKAEGYKDKVLTCYPSDSPPKLLTTINMNGVRTQTKKAWEAFVEVRDSGILGLSDEIGEIEALISSGRNAVLKAFIKAAL